MSGACNQLFSRVDIDVLSTTLLSLLLMDLRVHCGLKSVDLPGSGIVLLHRHFHNAPLQRYFYTAPNGTWAGIIKHPQCFTLKLQICSLLDLQSRVSCTTIAFYPYYPQFNGMHLPDLSFSHVWIARPTHLIISTPWTFANVFRALALIYTCTVVLHMLPHFIEPFRGAKLFHLCCYSILVKWRASLNNESNGNTWSLCFRPKLIKYFVILQQGHFALYQSIQRSGSVIHETTFPDENIEFITSTNINGSTCHLGWGMLKQGNWLILRPCAIGWQCLHLTSATQMPMPFRQTCDWVFGRRVLPPKRCSLFFTEHHPHLDCFDPCLPRLSDII